MGHENRSDLSIKIPYQDTLFFGFTIDKMLKPLIEKGNSLDTSKLHLTAVGGLVDDDGNVVCTLSCKKASFNQFGDLAFTLESNYILPIGFYYLSFTLVSKNYRQLLSGNPAHTQEFKQSSENILIEVTQSVSLLGAADVYADDVSYTQGVYSPQVEVISYTAFVYEEKK